nr:MAG TPA: hypothetical protein [Caudoviricetes sp.]
MRDGYQKLLNYVQEIEEKHGSVCMMTKRESNYMHKLSKPCYRNEYVNLNKYEVTIINKYLSGDIIIRQLAYYLNTTDGKALKMAKLYAMGRYDLTDHRNYWEMKSR